MAVVMGFGRTAVAEGMRDVRPCLRLSCLAPDGNYYVGRIDRSRALSQFNRYRTAFLQTDACTKRWFRFILDRLQPGRKTEVMGPNPGTLQLEESGDGS
ncbi:unnamed protein product [Nezara viridula]|uniref:Uncharacterized protein n=1 Tax=Nezara viridula TaxID=85310 RepID=A0A9P0EF61_NEZVI|nr:unnamed protein product [Nezara viridula]